jgi:hypothetical protein
MNLGGIRKDRCLESREMSRLGGDCTAIEIMRRGTGVLQVKPGTLGTSLRFTTSKHSWLRRIEVIIG